MKKILIAISFDERFPFPQYFEGQLQTWIQEISPHTKVIRYRSKIAPKIIQVLDRTHEKLRYSNRWGRVISAFNYLVSPYVSRNIPRYRYDGEQEILNVDTWSTVRLFGRRNLALFSWFYRETDFDFLFAINTSTYVSPRLLLEFVKKLDPRDNLYVGSIQKYDELGGVYISGAGKLLARSTVSKILDRSDEYPMDNLEDISLGLFLKTLGASFVNEPFLQLESRGSVEGFDLDVLSHFFYFRCKSDKGVENDLEVMRTLHDKLCRKSLGG